MSNELILFGTVSVILSGAMTVCLWKVVSCLERTSSSSNRSLAKERHDFMAMVQKLTEKRDVPVPQQLDLSALHAQERVALANQDTKEEIELGKRIKPSVKEDSILKDLVNTDPAGSMHS